jgi:L-fuconolactonase
MRLVDTHAHVWGSDTTELPWQSDALPPGWSGPYTHRDLRAGMAEVGIDEAVLMATTLYGRGERANEYTLRALEAHPESLWGVGVTEYSGSESALRQRVRRILDHDRMLGLRFHAAFEYAEVPSEMDRSAEWFADEALDPLYDELAAQDGSAFLLAKPEQFGTAASLADSHPDVTFVIEHVGWPDEGATPDSEPWSDIEAMGEIGNVCVKVSSVPAVTDGSYPYESVAGYLSSLLEWFGPERLLLGSDYPWLDEMATYEEEGEFGQDELERKADEYGFDYVRLEGNVGIIGNGAGLVMTTLDLVDHYGGSPANFLDVGGGAKADRIANALDMVFSDDNVDAVVFNIFGGITRGDEVAEGINRALGQFEEVPKPVVVRLAGTNAEEGMAILDEDLVTVEDTLEAAVQRAVEYAEEVAE